MARRDYTAEMHAEKTRPHVSNVSRNPGREAVRRNGERHYINQRPAFALHYHPSKQPEQPEELWYHVFEHELIVYGYKLLPLYERLKANAWEVLEESQGVYDPNSAGPFILKIEYRMAL